MPAYNQLAASSLLNQQYAAAIGLGNSMNSHVLLMDQHKPTPSVPLNSFRLLHISVIVFFMQGLCFQAYMLEGAPWWKSLFKPSKWIELGRGETSLYPRSGSSSGKEGLRNPEERFHRPEGPLEPTVSIHNCINERQKYSLNTIFTYLHKSEELCLINSVKRFYKCWEMSICAFTSK